MSNESFFVHSGYNGEQETRAMQTVASHYNLKYYWEGLKNDVFRSGDKIKKAKMVGIWNGKQHTTPLVARICEIRNIPKFYMEWGMLRQSEHFFVDPRGFCGDSILNHDLSWVNNEDIRKMLNKRDRLQQQYKLKDEGYILVPLQIENDTQVLFYTKYNSMDEFIKDIEDIYPNERVIIKPHPNSTAKRKSNKEIFKEKVDFLELASKASVVVGLTSTTLYEAAILGKKVVSLANHPLYNKTPEEKELILAGANFLNIPRPKPFDDHILQVLDRFNIRPKK